MNSALYLRSVFAAQPCICQKSRCIECGLFQFNHGDGSFWIRDRQMSLICTWYGTRGSDSFNFAHFFRDRVERYCSDRCAQSLYCEVYLVLLIAQNASADAHR